jgi:hypothetical protein
MARILVISGTNLLGTGQGHDYWATKMVEENLSVHTCIDQADIMDFKWGIDEEINMAVANKILSGGYNCILIPDFSALRFKSQQLRSHLAQFERCLGPPLRHFISRQQGKVAISSSYLSSVVASINRIFGSNWLVGDVFAPALLRPLCRGGRKTEQPFQLTECHSISGVAISDALYGVCHWIPHGDTPGIEPCESQGPGALETSLRQMPEEEAFDQLFGKRAIDVAVAILEWGDGGSDLSAESSTLGISATSSSKSCEVGSLLVVGDVNLEEPTRDKILTFFGISRKACDSDSTTTSASTTSSSRRAAAMTLDGGSIVATAEATAEASQDWVVWMEGRGGSKCIGCGVDWFGSHASIQEQGRGKMCPSCFTADQMSLSI